MQIFYQELLLLAIYILNLPRNCVAVANNLKEIMQQRRENKNEWGEKMAKI
jgi:hypothetical protein